MSQETALAAIREERARQEELKAKGRYKFTCADPELTHAERLTILAEELGEVAHEVNETIGGHATLYEAGLRKELIQVAAVALAWLEALPE